MKTAFKSTGQPRVARDGRAMVRQTFMCPSKVMPKQDMLLDLIFFETYFYR